MIKLNRINLVSGSSSSGKSTAAMKLAMDSMRPIYSHSNFDGELKYYPIPHLSKIYGKRGSSDNNIIDIKDFDGCVFILDEYRFDDHTFDILKLSNGLDIVFVVTIQEYSIITDDNITLRKFGYGNKLNNYIGPYIKETSWFRTTKVDDDISLSVVKDTLGNDRSKVKIDYVKVLIEDYLSMIRDKKIEDVISSS